MKKSFKDNVGAFIRVHWRKCLFIVAIILFWTYGGARFILNKVVAIYNEVYSLALQNQNNGVFTFVNILSNVVTTLFVAFFTFLATTYTYRKQKKESLEECQDKLHLILKEMGNNTKKLHRLRDAIIEFDKNAIDDLQDVKYAIRCTVDLAKVFVDICKDNWFENYKEFYRIFSKRTKVVVRSNKSFGLAELVELSDLEDAMADFQLRQSVLLEHSMDIKNKLLNSRSFFTEDSDVQKKDSFSEVERLLRQVKNEGYFVDDISDMEIKGISFYYNRREGLASEIRTIAKEIEVFENDIRKYKGLSEHVKRKYFNEACWNKE